MSERRTEERLEAMLAMLREPPARLDEIAQARVRSRLDAALAAADAVEARTAGRRWRRWVIGGVGLAAAAALAVVVASAGEPGTANVVAVPQAPLTGSASAIADGGRAAVASAATPKAEMAAAAAAAAHNEVMAALAAGGADFARAVDGTRTRIASASSHDPVNAASPPRTPPALRATTPATPVLGATPVTVAAGESAHLTLGGASVTVYGPGRLSSTPDGAVVEAAGIVVDRPHGDTPWSVRYHGTRIVVTQATFALDRGARTRVSVMRGEIELRCPSGSRTIRSGASATCEPKRVTRLTASSRPSRSAPPEPPPPAEPDPDPSEPPPAQQEAVAIDRYAAAEAAMRRGDVDAASKVLLAIIAAAPDSLDAATALLDLARLAASRRDATAALDYLDRLDRHPRRAALALPARRLRATLPPRDIITGPLTR
jgi:hypothetical protein